MADMKKDTKNMKYAMAAVVVMATIGCSAAVQGVGDGAGGGAGMGSDAGVPDAHAVDGGLDAAPDGAPDPVCSDKPVTECSDKANGNLCTEGGVNVCEEGRCCIPHSCYHLDAAGDYLITPCPLRCLDIAGNRVVCLYCQPGQECTCYDGNGQIPCPFEF